MARQTLVLDASVGVKWFSAAGEGHVSEARAILLEYARGDLAVMVPDLFFHEIANALVHKKTLSAEQLSKAMSTLWALGLTTLRVNEDLLKAATQLAREAKITEYDAFYVVAAIENGCPLVTANPRHQRKGLRCEVIPIERWT